MKRGLSGLIFLALLLSTPIVLAADSVLDLFLGSSDESILFLKLMYGTMVFIIFFKATQESVFKKEQARLAQVFSLLLAFFAMRYTPNVVITSFGWLIMALAPFLVLYKISSVFVKKEEGKFSWIRFLFALLGTLLIFAAFGSTSVFSAGLGKTPYAGGFFDEAFSGIHYFFFHTLDTFFVIFIVTVVLGLLLLGLRRLPGMGGGAGTGEGGFGAGFGKGLLLVLGVAGLLALLAYLFGGGIGALVSPILAAGTLGVFLQGLYWLLLVLGGILLLYLFFRFKLWRAIPWSGKRLWSTGKKNWTWLRFVLFGLLVAIVFLALFYFLPFLLNPWLLIPFLLLVLLVLYLRYRKKGVKKGAATTPGKGVGRANRILIVDLETPTQTIPHHPNTHAFLSVQPGTTVPFVFTAYTKRFRWSVRKKLVNAAFTFRVNNGALVPANGNTDLQGRLRALYTAPNVVGTALLQVTVSHPDILPTSVLPDYTLLLGALQAGLRITVAPVTIPLGNPADIVIELTDTSGDGVNGASVSIVFPRTPGLGPFTGSTVGGGSGTPAVCTVRTPVFSRDGTYAFTVSVTVAGYASPTPALGDIRVVSPKKADLEISDVTTLVAGGRATRLPAITQMRVGQGVDISLVVMEYGIGGVQKSVDTATVTLTSPGIGIRLVPRGGGSYMASFVPTAAQIGTQHFVIQAQLSNHNDATEYITIEVEDLPQLNVGITVPPSPMRQGMQENIVVEVTDVPGTTPGGRPVAVKVTLTVNGKILADQKTDPRTGKLSVPFIAPPASGTATYTFTVHVREAGYRDPPDQSFSVIVAPLAPADVAVQVLDSTGAPLSGALTVGDTAAIDVFVRDPTTGTPVTTGYISITPQRYLRSPSGRLDLNGHYHTEFAASAVGTFPYTISLSGSPGFVPPRTAPSVSIVVLPQPEMRITVNWVPDPSPADKYILMNFTVIDIFSGDPLQGIRVTVKNVNSAHPVRIRGPDTTNGQGQLDADLRIDLNGRTLARGTVEQHSLAVEVQDPQGRYPPKINGTTPITIKFQDPRAGVGGAKSVSF